MTDSILYHMIDGDWKSARCNYRMFYIYVYIHIYLYIYVVHIYTYLHIYIYLYIYIYTNIYVYVYNRWRLEECKKQLRDVLGQEKLAGASLLIFANKQDLGDKYMDIYIY
jgi:hypothetical protein